MHTTELGAPAANGAETSPASAQDPPPSPGPPLPPPSRALSQGLRIYFAILNFKRSGNRARHSTELGAPAAKGAETSPRRAQDPPPSPGPLGKVPQFTLQTKFHDPTRIRADPTPPPLPPPPPSPALAPHQGGRRRGLRMYFAILNFKRCRDLVMEGLIHTTELGRLNKPQALSPTPPPPPLPHLPLPRPWLVIREADAGGLRIYFAILNFKRLAGIEPGTLPCRASYIPRSWAGCTSLEPFPRPPPPSTTPSTSPFPGPDSSSGRQTQGASEFISRF